MVGYVHFKTHLFIFMATNEVLIIYIKKIGIYQPLNKSIINI